MFGGHMVQDTNVQQIVSGLKSKDEFHFQKRFNVNI